MHGTGSFSSHRGAITELGFTMARMPRSASLGKPAEHTSSRAAAQTP